MSLPSVLKVQDLSVGFDRILIKKLQFELKLGDRLIIYGSNGIGKSTLLKSLVKNSLALDGQIQWQIPREEILYLHQQENFHSQTPDDVESYLLHILLYKKPFARATSLDHEKIQSVLRQLHLTNMPLKYLSGGQRQKLKIAQGLLVRTQALLLDEPFNAIDQVSSQEIIQWLNQSQNRMIQILILHDFEQIERLKSPVLWLKPDSWEILGFEDWFRKVDKQFHNWIKTVQPPTLAESLGSVPSIEASASVLAPGKTASSNISATPP